MMMAAMVAEQLHTDNAAMLGNGILDANDSDSRVSIA